MGDNPFDEPDDSKLLPQSGKRASYGGSGGYQQPKEMFADTYVEERDDQAYKPELQFQNFQHTNAPPSNRASTMGSPQIRGSTSVNGGAAVINSEPTVAVDFGDESNRPLASGQPSAPPPVDTTNAKIWQIQYYRSLFNVDTTQVVQRILRSLMPFRFGFIETAKTNPDFYGPFWIATSLIFVLAMTGNLYSFFNTHSLDGSADTTTSGSGSAAKTVEVEWSYNFNVIVVGTVVFYGYTIVIPLVLWGVFKYLQVPVKPLEIICIYGYSLFIYIPISIACVVPMPLMQWILTIFGCLWSGFFLVSNLLVVVKDFALKRGIAAMMVVSGLHVALALTYKLYFFEKAYGA